MNRLQSPEAINSTDDVFNSDHILDVQDLQICYSLEYGRKSTIIQSVAANESDETYFEEVSHTNDFSRLCADWPDEHPESFLDQTKGMDASRCLLISLD